MKDHLKPPPPSVVNRKPVPAVSHRLHSNHTKLSPLFVIYTLPGQSLLNLLNFLIPLGKKVAVIEKVIHFIYYVLLIKVKWQCARSSAIKV